MIDLKNNSNISVIGYGSWATTLVGQLLKKGNTVNWQIRNQEVLEHVLEYGNNPKYVSDLELKTENLFASSDINEVVGRSDVLLLGTPSAYLKDVLAELTIPISEKFVISAVKGIIPENYQTILEYIHDTYNIPYSQLGVIAGPTHAEEVSRGKLSYLTAACKDEENAKAIADMMSSKELLINTSTDIYGIEYASILKNIYAIAAGMAAGLGYGDNFLAVLISECANELKRFINESYPSNRDVTGRAYLGDLLVTCYSIYSRNRRLGQLIGRGNSVKSALNEMTMVAEGYFAAETLHHVNMKHGISIPIADMVYSVLYENARPRKAMDRLSKEL